MGGQASSKRNSGKGRAGKVARRQAPILDWRDLVLLLSTPFDSKPSVGTAKTLHGGTCAVLQFANGTPFPLAIPWWARGGSAWALGM